METSISLCWHTFHTFCSAILWNRRNVVKDNGKTMFLISIMLMRCSLNFTCLLPPSPLAWKNTCGCMGSRHLTIFWCINFSLVCLCVCVRPVTVTHRSWKLKRHGLNNIFESSINQVATSAFFLAISAREKVKEVFNVFKFSQKFQLVMSSCHFNIALPLSKVAFPTGAQVRRMN